MVGPDFDLAIIKVDAVNLPAVLGNSQQLELGI